MQLPSRSFNIVRCGCHPTSNFRNVVYLPLVTKLSDIMRQQINQHLLGGGHPTSEILDIKNFPLLVIPANLKRWVSSPSHVTQHWKFGFTWHHIFQHTRLVPESSFFLRWHARLLWYSNKSRFQNMAWYHTLMYQESRLLFYLEILILKKWNFSKFTLQLSSHHSVILVWNVLIFLHNRANLQYNL